MGKLGRKVSKRCRTVTGVLPGVMKVVSLADLSKRAVTRRFMNLDEVAGTNRRAPGD
jgi:hypothetical protein